MDAVDMSLRPGKSQEKKLIKRRCLGVLASLFRGCGFLPLEGVRGFNNEPDLTGSAAKGAKDAVATMDRRYLEMDTCKRCTKTLGLCESINTIGRHCIRNREYIVSLLNPRE